MAGPWPPAVDRPPQRQKRFARGAMTCSPVYRNRRESSPVESDWISVLKIALVCLAVQVAYHLGKGWRPHLRDFRLWGEGVTPEQRRSNLMGLGVLASLVGIGVLF